MFKCLNSLSLQYFQLSDKRDLIAFVIINVQLTHGKYGAGEFKTCLLIMETRPKTLRAAIAHQLPFQKERICFSWEHLPIWGAVKRMPLLAKCIIHIDPSLLSEFAASLNTFIINSLLQTIQTAKILSLRASHSARLVLKQSKVRERVCTQINLVYFVQLRPRNELACQKGSTTLHSGPLRHNHRRLRSLQGSGCGCKW